jgi:hypothetical protein
MGMGVVVTLLTPVIAVLYSANLKKNKNNPTVQICRNCVRLV